MLSHSKKPLLLVEDDLVDQMMVKKAFSELGIQRDLVVFSNGEEVVKYLRSDSPRPFLIISDVNMPKMGGLELIKEIQNDESLNYKGKPFVILSTACNDFELKDAYTSGIHGFFEKNVQYKELVKSLGRIIEYWEESKIPE